MPHPTRLSKAHMAQLKAGIDRRVAGVKSKIDNAMDTIESRAEKVKVLRHGMLRRQLSFFSVPPEDREDPIPHTNVFLGVLYVLGAVAVNPEVVRHAVPLELREVDVVPLLALLRITKRHIELTGNGGGSRGTANRDTSSENPITLNKNQVGCSCAHID